MLSRRLLALAGTAALVFAACSSGGGTATTAPSAAAPSASAGGSSPSASASASAGPSLPTAADLGSPQGQSINVLAWPGYVENGSTDKTVDWVTWELFFKDIKKAMPDYPIRFELFKSDVAVHGTPLRMVDWRMVLNWMLKRDDG